MGLRPAKTHLMDPHTILRMVALAQRLTPFIRWRARHQRRTSAAALPVARSAAPAAQTVISQALR
jgi:hypothetical protein